MDLSFSARAIMSRSIIVDVDGGKNPYTPMMLAV